jgi:hypothetical protein
MTTILLLQLVLSSAFFFAGSFQASAQEKDPSPTPSPEEHQKEERTEDPIYSGRWMTLPTGPRVRFSGGVLKMKSAHNQRLQRTGISLSRIENLRLTSPGC